MALFPLEETLLECITQCPSCAGLGVTAQQGERFGILVLQRGQHVGIWSVIQGALVFRSLANWYAIDTASSIDHARALTIGMATTGRWSA